VVAKRIPIVNGSASLALKIRGAHGSGGSDIVMQTRAEEVPEEMSTVNPSVLSSTHHLTESAASVVEAKEEVNATTVSHEDERMQGIIGNGNNQNMSHHHHNNIKDEVEEEGKYEMELSSAEMMTENELTMLNDIQTVDKYVLICACVC